jgi:hypothetical protein
MFTNVTIDAPTATIMAAVITAAAVIIAALISNRRKAKEHSQITPKASASTDAIKC